MLFFIILRYKIIWFWQRRKMAFFISTFNPAAFHWTDEKEQVMHLLKYQLLQLHCHGNVFISLPRCARVHRQKLSIFSGGGAVNRNKPMLRFENVGCVCWCGAEHIIVLGSSQQARVQCSGWTICCCFPAMEMWGITHNVAQRTAESFLLSSGATDGEGGRNGSGEPGAESISQSEQWIDTSSIEELWWLWCSPPFVKRQPAELPHVLLSGWMI